MSQDDVWSAGEEAGGQPSVGIGSASYDGGLGANECFSIDRVVKWGLALLQEQPALALLGGFNLFLIQFLPGLAATPAQLAIGAWSAAVEMPDEVANALSQMVGFAVQMLFMPIQFLVMAGFMVAAAQWIVGGEASIGALYTSVTAAVRALLTGLLSGVIYVVALLLCMSPGIVAMALLWSADSWALSLGVGGLLLLVGVVPLVYVALGLMLAAYAAVLDDAWPVEAIQQSWAAASGARITLFVTSFVFGILGLLSCFLCFLPNIPLMGIQIPGFTAAWLRYARPLDETKGWDFFERAS